MFKFFGRVKEILAILLDVAKKVSEVHDLFHKTEADQRLILERLNEIQTRVATIERVEDLILRQNEQLLGRVYLPPDLETPPGP